MINHLNQRGRIDWNTWASIYVEKCLNFFIDMKWCKKKTDIKKQYMHFLVQFVKVEKDKEKILDIIIDETPGLKTFMILHSVFDIDADKKGDWLERYMIEKLRFSNKEIDKIIHPEPIPQHILDLVKIFEPEQILFEIYPIRIEYGMWRRDKNNKIVDPVYITDLSWENKPVLKPEDIGKALSEYEDIECDPDKQYQYNPLAEDDLPF